MMLPFFVYGTLKPGEENYPRYLAGRTAEERPATISGAALYTEGRYPFLVIDPRLVQPDEQVTGVLIALKPGHYYSALRYIDDLEGYQPGNPHNWYERIVHPVQPAAAHATPVEAWVYVAGADIVQRIQGHSRRMTKIAGSVWSRH